MIVVFVTDTTGIRTSSVQTSWVSSNSWLQRVPVRSLSRPVSAGRRQHYNLYLKASMAPNNKKVNLGIHHIFNKNTTPSLTSHACKNILQYSQFEFDFKHFFWAPDHTDQNLAWHSQGFQGTCVAHRHLSDRVWQIMTKYLPIQPRLLKQNTASYNNTSELLVSIQVNKSWTKLIIEKVTWYMTASIIHINPTFLLLHIWKFDGFKGT